MPRPFVTQSSLAPPSIAIESIAIQIVGLLSTGGMGEVYRGRDRALERERVRKVPSNEAVSRAELLEQFIREARAASALNDIFIVTIYEIGEREYVTSSPWNPSADARLAMSSHHGTRHL
jgi:serine/threonine protein kinase